MSRYRRLCVDVSSGGTVIGVSIEWRDALDGRRDELWCDPAPPEGLTPHQALDYVLSVVKAKDQPSIFD